MNAGHQPSDPFDPLDREIVALHAVDPSPEFQARIRTRVDREPPPSRRWWRQPVMAAAAIAAAAALAVVVGIDRADPPGGQPSAQPVAIVAGAVGPGRASALIATGGVEAAPTAALAPVARRIRAGRGRSSPRAVPAPLTTPEDARAFQVLLRRLADGTLEARAGAEIRFLAEAPEPVGRIVIQPSEIAPIEIAPIADAFVTGEAE